MNRDNSAGNILTMKLSIFVCHGHRIHSGRNRRRPPFLRKHQLSLTKMDGVQYRHNINYIDGFMFDLYVDRYTEVSLLCEEKIASEKIYPRLFVISP